MRRLIACLVLGLAALGMAGPSWAQDAAASAPAAAVAAEAVASAPATAAPAATVQKGDVAWMLTATMLVIMMTVPGLALFYGGLVRAKNMLSVLMQVMTVFSMIVVLWGIYGYSLAFGGGGAFIGVLDKAFLSGVSVNSLADTFTAEFKLPEYVFAAFQATFAGITCALIVGSFAERIKFSAVLLFSALWFTFSYLPIAHMVWFGEGYLFKAGALDFAGGTVVHINAGVAGLVGAYVIGRRVGYGREALAPHSLPLTMVGASLLWVGWFGFNAGSAVAADGAAGMAMAVTQICTATAALSWMFAEWIVLKKPSVLGIVSGAVAGLVAITPASGFVDPMGALWIGIAAGVICFIASVKVKHALGYDDSLDVFGIHGVGGIVGAILTGWFAVEAIGGTAGSMSQVIIQFEGIVATIVWSGIASFVILKIIDFTIGLRVEKNAEIEGLDINLHGEVVQ